MTQHVQVQTLKEGRTYRHYKGGLYNIIKIAYATEAKTLNNPLDVNDDVKMVVYRPLDPHSPFGNDVWWVRPYRMFVETVIIDGVEQQRFTEVDAEPQSILNNTTEYLNV